MYYSFYDLLIRMVSWNARKSMWKIYFSRDGICICFWNAPKSNNFIFGSFSAFLKCPIFPIWFWNGKNGAFRKKSNPYMVRKLGISKKMHVINFKTGKEPKMKFFDFWAFQNFKRMLSHDKIIFHMLFGHFILPPVLRLVTSSISIELEETQPVLCSGGFSY